MKLPPRKNAKKPFRLLSDHPLNLSVVTILTAVLAGSEDPSDSLLSSLVVLVPLSTKEKAIFNKANNQKDGSSNKDIKTYQRVKQ